MYEPVVATETSLPMDVTGWVVLIAALLVTFAWLIAVYR